MSSRSFVEVKPTAPYRLIFYHSVLTKTMKKLVQNYQKDAGKKRSQKSKRSNIKYFFTIDFLTETTVGLLLVLHFCSFLLIFHIYTVQWLNCTNMKDELNCSYNVGGVVYLLQSELSHSTMQYCQGILASFGCYGI